MAGTAGEAVTQVSEVVTQALAALRDEGTAASDMRTTNLTVQDFFDQREQRVTARIASYQLEVTVRRPDDVGRILGSLTEAVGDSFQIRGLQLTLGNPEPLRRTARRLAVEDARTKAAELAEAAGVHLGAILSIEERTAPRPGTGFGQAFGSTAGAAGPMVVPPVPVEPGMLSVTSWVALTYALDE
jgi:hypothetical protein